MDVGNIIQGNIGKFSEIKFLPRLAVELELVSDGNVTPIKSRLEIFPSPIYDLTPPPPLPSILTMFNTPQPSPTPPPAILQGKKSPLIIDVTLKSKRG